MTGSQISANVKLKNFSLNYLLIDCLQNSKKTWKAVIHTIITKSAILVKSNPFEASKDQTATYKSSLQLSKWWQLAACRKWWAYITI